MIYSIVRVLVFAAPLGILLALGFELWVAALVAAAIGFCLSYIFLRPLRDQVARQLAESRAARPASRGDEDAEDAELD